MKDKILDWLANGETGISSKTIAYKMAGIKLDRMWLSHPSDPGDFKRCLKLVNLIPDIRPRLGEMRSVSKEWDALIEHWKEVEDCFMDEVAEWLTDEFSQKRATKTYDLMKKIYTAATNTNSPSGK